MMTLREAGKFLDEKLPDGFDFALRESGGPLMGRDALKFEGVIDLFDASTGEQWHFDVEGADFEPAARACIDRAHSEHLLDEEAERWRLETEQARSRQAAFDPNDIPF